MSKKAKVKDVATTYLGTKAIQGFRLRWLVYGAAAYYALRLMSKRGIFPKQANAALDLIDRGIEVAKRQIGVDVPAPLATGMKDKATGASLSH